MCSLNEMEEGVAPTDSRLRPDQRIMESGDFDKANAEKVRLSVSRSILIFCIICFASIHNHIGNSPYTIMHITHLTIIPPHTSSDMHLAHLTNTPHTCTKGGGGGGGGGVTPIDTIVTAATAGQSFDRCFWSFDR